MSSLMLIDQQEELVGPLSMDRGQSSAIACALGTIPAEEMDSKIWDYTDGRGRVGEFLEGEDPA